MVIKTWTLASFCIALKGMARLYSSWNSDRIAAAVCCRRHSKKNDYRPSAPFAQYKVGSDLVVVRTCRGREVYARHFGDTIQSARIVGDDLLVETVNGGRFVCDAETGELLEANPPAKPAVVEQSPEVSPESNDHVGFTHAV